MTVPFVTCRNVRTGAIADIPETALQHLTDYQPLDLEAEDQAEAIPPAAEPPLTAARPARKSKAAAPAATTEKE